ncbi:MAG: NAD(P)-dependent oxidoreductase [Hyphomicrobiaceae bacterium]|nr:NAD(P)-dependent oxidoreductase [Hyphomicrobiaceae bacterium]
MDTPQPIGVIGLGELGSAIASRLVAKGHRIRLYDLDGNRRRSFPVARLASEIAPSLTDFGNDCEIIMAALPDIAALRDAAYGDDDRPGFAHALRPGSVIIHFGTGPYMEVLRLTGQLGHGGVGLIDALTCANAHPSDGCPMEMLVGGFDDLVERARPALEALGSFTRIGGTGSATGLAALRGYVRAARLIALSEAMLIGRHAGIDPGLLARVFDGPIAAGPECRSLTGEAATLLREHDLDTTSRHVADAVAFSERIGVSGECVAFARDMLADALSGSVGTDESTLLKHFSALAEAEI